MVLSTILAFTVLISTAVYFYVKKSYNYWKDQNVPYIKPKFPQGTIGSIGKEYHVAELMQNFYNELKGQYPYGGLYSFIKPAVIAIDLNFIKNVMIKDFNYFHERGVYYNERDDPLSAHLFALGGAKWKRMRTKLTPTFTSGKMKFMFSTIVNVAEKFKTTMTNLCENGQEIDVRDVVSRFTTDVIGSCAFGIDCNSLSDPNAEFRKMGKQFLQVPRYPILIRLFLNAFRELGRKLHIKIVANDVSNFFLRITKETTEYREKAKLVRNDFMDLLIQLKNDETSEDRLSIPEMSAQSFVFFVAGFETSSTLMSFCLNELAVHQSIQERVRNEVETILKKYNGQMTYDAIMELHYTDQVLNETLRKYPPLANLVRVVSENYLVPETNNTLKKGTTVNIPIYAIQRDAEYFPDPEKFDPDRFLPENISKRHPCAFMPFGEGPRNCIGLRFGMLQARIGLAMMIKKFKFSPGKKMVHPIVIKKTATILSPKNDSLWLVVKKI